MVVDVIEGVGEVVVVVVVLKNVVLVVVNVM